MFTPKHGWLDTKKSRNYDIVGHFAPHVWATTGAIVDDHQSHIMIIKKHGLSVPLPTLVCHPNHHSSGSLSQNLTWVVARYRVARDICRHYGSTFFSLILAWFIQIFCSCRGLKATSEPKEFILDMIKAKKRTVSFVAIYGLQLN
jgi:hypothetical protein